MPHRSARRAARARALVGALVASSLAAACTPTREGETPDPAAAAAAPAAAAPTADLMAHNTLTEAERTAGWRLLFDGTTTTGWRGYKASEMPAGWRVVEGRLTKGDPTGDIVTVDQFEDFELAFDWRLAEGGNAGLFYRGTEEFDRIYWSAPEYQLLDDANAADGRNRLTAAGAAYGLYPAPAGVVKPAGEWNSSRVLVQDGRVEHWLNGQKLLEYTLGSPDWEAKVQASKFKDWPGYGRAGRGHIAFQGDHSGELSLRDVKIRELP